MIRATSRLGLIANPEEIEAQTRQNIGSNAMEKIHRPSSLALAVWLIHQEYCNTVEIALQFGLSQP